MCQRCLGYLEGPDSVKHLGLTLWQRLVWICLLELLPLPRIFQTCKFVREVTATVSHVNTNAEGNAAARLGNTDKFIKRT